MIGDRTLSRIQGTAIKDDYKLEVLLDNGSSITLSFKSRLGTVCFGLLADKKFFAKAAVDGNFVRLENKVEISFSELFQLAQK